MLRREVWDGDINLGVDRELIFKCMKLDEIINEVNMDRERGLRMSSGYLILRKEEDLVKLDKKEQ